MSTFWLRTSYTEMFGHEPSLSDIELGVLLGQANLDVEFALELARERDPAAPAPMVES